MQTYQPEDVQSLVDFPTENLFHYSYFSILTFSVPLSQWASPSVKKNEASVIIISDKGQFTYKTVRFHFLNKTGG